MLSAHYTHIKRTPKSRCAICSGFEDTAKMSSRSRGTCPGDLAGDRGRGRWALGVGVRVAGWEDGRWKWKRKMGMEMRDRDRDAQEAPK